MDELQAGIEPTMFSDLLNVGDPAKKQELKDRHVLFMEDGSDKYLGEMFARIGQGSGRGQRRAWLRDAGTPRCGE